jgi:tetratricopeptide (TPR) repeat protein
VDYDQVAAAGYYEQARAAAADLSAWAHNQALLFDGPLGRYDDAIAYLKEAERKDPLAPNVKWTLMYMYLVTGRNADAVAAVEDLVELGSRAPAASGILGRVFLTTGGIGRARECPAAMRTITGVEGPDTVGLQFAIDAATGDREDAQQLLDRLLGPVGEAEPASYYLIGEGYKTLGDYDRAIDRWARAVDRHEAWTLVGMAQHFARSRRGGYPERTGEGRSHVSSAGAQ